MASTRWRRALGLMGRTALGDCDGMLFIYPQPRKVRLWMAHTSLSLDAIFVDASGCIVKIAHRLSPNTKRQISSGTPASWVLEIGGGQAMQLGIAAGDRVHLFH